MVQENRPGHIHKVVCRVEHRHNLLQHFRQDAQGIEQRRQVHPGRRRHVVDIVGIPHEDIGHRQQHPQSEAEQEHLQAHQRERSHMDARKSAREHQHDHQRDHLEQEVDHRAAHAGQWKNVVGNPGLAHQPAVLHDRGQHNPRALRHEGKHQPPGAQVDREVLNLVVEHLGKHDRQDQHDEQRIQHAPYVSQHALPVFLFQFPCNQVFQQRKVFHPVPVRQPDLVPCRQRHGVPPSVRPFLSFIISLPG